MGIVSSYSSHTKTTINISFSCEINTTYTLNQSNIRFLTQYGESDTLFTYEYNYITTMISVFNVSYDQYFTIFLISDVDIIDLQIMISSDTVQETTSTLITNSEEIPEEFVYLSVIILFCVGVWFYAKK